MRTYSLLLCLLFSAGIGCTSDNDPQPTSYEGALRKTRTCDELLDAIQEDEIAKVDRELRYWTEGDPYGFGPPVAIGDFGTDGAGGAAGSPQPTNGEDADAPTGFSDTNRQVAEVDEADIVKIGYEGTKLFVLRENELFVLDSWPAASTAVTNTVELEGYAIEMFVDGDRVVVFSSVYDVEGLDEGTLCGAEPFAGVSELDESYYCGRSHVKTTVIALDGESPEVVREVYVDGYYSSSRRHGDVVRAIVQSDLQRPASVPQLWQLYEEGPYPQTREEEIERVRVWASAAKAAIAQTSLDDWLPAWAERVDGELRVQPRQCADFYAPEPGATNYGMTQVVGLDLGGDAPPAITTVLGQASRVYANAETLILTQPDQIWHERETNQDQTVVHRFAVSFDQQRTPYEGSGFVPGLVNDQFSIDERDGIIRIATTRTTWTPNGGLDEWIPPVTDNMISTMARDEGGLVVLGSTPPLAEGERIFAARFIGDLAYVVTFRQVDPLFAIDLSDPANPRVLGELKIPGFSDYMHPLDENHLLTIGRDIDEETQFDRGTALQIFDVTDPTSPVQKFQRLVGDGFSEANHNHKAFNFYADKGLLAFPFVSYERGFESTLELWDVSVDEGFSRRGAVDHSSLVIDDCGGWLPPVGQPFFADEFYSECGYLPQVSRGVFIDDYVYSISHGGVMVHDVTDLEAAVAVAPF